MTKPAQLGYFTEGPEPDYGHLVETLTQIEDTLRQSLGRPFMGNTRVFELTVTDQFAAIKRTIPDISQEEVEAHIPVRGEAR